MCELRQNNFKIQLNKTTTSGNKSLLLRYGSTCRTVICRRNCCFEVLIKKNSALYHYCALHFVPTPFRGKRLRELLNVALKAIIETKASVLSYHLFRQLYEKTDEDYERRVLHKYVGFRKVIAYLAVVIFAEASLISSVRRVSER